MHYLVADGDENNFTGRVVRQDVGLDPLSGGVWIRSEGGNVTVGGADDDADSGIGQGLNDSRICAVEPYFLDGSRLQELGRSRGWRQIIRHLPIVNPYKRLRSCREKYTVSNCELELRRRKE